MNLELTIYLIKANVLIVFMFLLYKVFMSRSIYHQWSRFYLLIAPVLAFIAPLISFRGGSSGVFEVELPLVDLIHTSATIKTGSCSLFELLIGVWIVGMLVKAFLSLYHLRQIVRQMTSTDTNRTFTFLKRVSIAGSLSDEVKSKVRIHEQVHADQLHSLDLIWYELLRIIFWFNPVLSMAQFSLKQIHEYIADSETNRQTTNYSETLVAHAFGLNKLPLASEFQSVNIKNRIKMMNKKKSKIQGAGVVMSLTLALIAIMTISWTSVNTSLDVNDVKAHKKVEQMQGKSI